MNRDRDSEAEAIQGSRLLLLRWPVLLGGLALILSPFDEAFVRAVNPDHPIALDAVGRWMDAWSTRLLLLFFAGALFGAYLFRRLASWRIPATAFTLAWLGTELVVGTLKRVVGRPRPLHPDAIAVWLRPLYDRPDTKSFPSGHSATAFCCAVGLALWWRHPAFRVLIFAFAAAIAVSRSYVGAHYLSDILAGSAVGWAFMALSWRLTVLERGRVLAAAAPRRLWPLTLVAFAIVLSWLFKADVRVVDAMTAGAADGFVHRESWTRTALEPFVGLGLEVAAVPEARAWCLDAAAWSAGIALLWLVWRRRRALAPIAVLGGYGVLTYLVAFGGLGIQGRMEARSGAGAFDLQSHVADPTDGAIAMEPGLARYARLGFDFVQPTHHNAWSPARRREEGGAWVTDEGMLGMEWSSGAHTDSPLHVLLFSPEPVPHDPDLETMLARLHDAGGLAVVAHFWRGDARRLPSLEELRAAGVDGFEIAGRCQEDDPAALRRQARIRELVGRHDMIALVNSDFHGKRSFNYQWNFLDGRAPDAAAVWAALRSQRRSIRNIVLESPPPPGWARGVMRPWHTVIRYLRELSLRGRAAWLAYLAAAGSLSTAFRRRSRSRTSSPSR